jgi:hypothetical protein
MHVHRRHLRSASSVCDDGLLSVYAAERDSSVRETDSPLAAVRGALLGSALGTVCWAALATLTWFVLS